MVTLSRKPILILFALFIGGLIVMPLLSESPKAAEDINKAEIQKIVREYLVENPEIVIKAIEAYQANEKNIKQSEFEKTLQTSKNEIFAKDLPFAGNPDADVVMVEFFDYNCGYCKRALKDVQKTLKNDKDVKVIFREMPILSPSSRDAARYALAAHKQGKYFEYHQALLSFNGSKSTDNLEKVASAIGLDVDLLRKDAASKDVRRELEKSIALSHKLGLRGTPAFIINDIFAPGYITYEAMQDFIKEARNVKK